MDRLYPYWAIGDGDLVEKRKMDTPTNEFYVGLSRDELVEQLSQVESELSAFHAQRAVINQQEAIAQEHRSSIQRALGCFVLEDRRTNVVT